MTRKTMKTAARGHLDPARFRTGRREPQLAAVVSEGTACWSGRDGPAIARLRDSGFVVRDLGPAPAESGVIPSRGTAVVR
jgi:hypothetical protein